MGNGTSQRLEEKDMTHGPEEEKDTYTTIWSGDKCEQIPEGQYNDHLFNAGSVEWLFNCPFSESTLKQMRQAAEDTASKETWAFSQDTPVTSRQMSTSEHETKASANKIIRGGSTESDVAKNPPLVVSGKYYRTGTTSLTLTSYAATYYPRKCRGGISVTTFKLRERNIFRWEDNESDKMRVVDDIFAKHKESADSINQQNIELLQQEIESDFPDIVEC